jgi:hypothetical protein
MQCLPYLLCNVYNPATLLQPPNFTTRNNCNPAILQPAIIATPVIMQPRNNYNPKPNPTIIVK